MSETKRSLVSLDHLPEGFTTQEEWDAEFVRVRDRSREETAQDLEFLIRLAEKWLEMTPGQRLRDPHHVRAYITGVVRKLRETLARVTKEYQRVAYMPEAVYRNIESTLLGEAAESWPEGLTAEHVVELKDHVRDLPQNRWGQAVAPDRSGGTPGDNQGASLQSEPPGAGSQCDEDGRHANSSPGSKEGREEPETEPRELTIADRIRLQGSPTQAALVDYMFNLNKATFDDIKDGVHGDKAVGDAAVRQRVSKTNQTLLELGARFQLRTEGGFVYKESHPQ